MLLDNASATVKNANSILSFETKGGGEWPSWYRYIAIDGKKAFEIGNVCGTCAFYFTRLDGANRSIEPKAVISALNAGLTNLESGVINDISTLFPDGNYQVLLTEVTPKLVKPGDSDDYFIDEQVEIWGIDGFYNLPHFPQTEYYRIDKRPFGKGACLFEFLIPTFPHNWLDGNTVQTYMKTIRNGCKPTAVSLSVLDIKEPAIFEDDARATAHWCLAHYLIDGHHKVYAAAQSQSPLTLLSFVATDHGISDVDDVESLVRTVLRTKE